MLELLKKQKTEKKLDEILNISNIHYPTSVREWDNSIYTYNKTNLNLIPFASKLALKLIKFFINARNLKFEKKLRYRRKRKFSQKFRLLSSHRVYLSSGEFKHKNDSVLINIYIFNRLMYNYLKRIKRKFFKKFLNKKFIKNFTRTHIIELIAKKNMYKSITKYTFNNTNVDTKTELKKGIKKIKKIIKLFFKYKKLIYIYRSLFNDNYASLLKKQLEILYNKKVDLNLINLKRFYLDSDILTETVKLKLLRNRKKMNKLLKKVQHKVKVPKREIPTDPEVQILENISNDLKLKKSVFKNLKYKKIKGFRIEAKGRLTKRNTASRSISQYKYKGNLINLYASELKFPSVILRGNLKANLQYTKLQSKTQIGSFGLKGWVSGD